MNKRKYFGTDGIRGEFGKFPIIPDFAFQVVWAASQVLSKQDNKTVVLGHDGRQSHQALSKAIIQGLNTAGITVLDCGLCPTPAMAFLCRHFNAGFAVMISASHNPAKDNGIKFFNAEGSKLSQAQERAIEKQIEHAPSFDESILLADLNREIVDDAIDLYQQFCCDSVNGCDLSSMYLVVDAANGAMSDVAPSVFERLNANVERCFCWPDGKNINAGCGATNVAALRQQVLEKKADLGIAFDGDGDRVMMVDAKGDILDGDAMIFLIATHAKQQKQFTGGVVGTLMSNMALETALAKHDIPVARANVGDAYVLAECHQRGWILGGEPSGHVICLQQTTTGDGLIAALQVLACLNQDDTPIQTRLNEYQPFPQLLVNVKVDNPSDAIKSAKLQSAIEKAENKLGNKGRVLVRASGTEPLIRIMVESADAALNQRLAEEIAGAGF